MYIVLLTAIGVGGATIFGAIIGFVFKKISHKFSDIILAFGAGVMLSASVLGLILPSVDYGGEYGVLITIFGIFVGAIAIDLIERSVPHINNLIPTVNLENESCKRVFLLVMAIAIHNLPEGIAAGVGFGTGEISSAIMIAVGIALQNIPEGMVLIGPMLSVGISPKKTLFYAMLTGVIEIIGTFIGYFTVNISSAILPFALSFAGGTMLYVISNEMIPETHSHGNERGASYALLLGFCLMLLF